MNMRLPSPSAAWMAITGAACLASLFVVVGCGGSSSKSDSVEAPSAASFPSAEGKSIEEVAAGAKPSKLNLAPAGQVFETGKSRYSFAVIDKSGKQVTDQEVALYLTRGPKDKVTGPYPAKLESLATDPSFRAQTTSQDPSAAEAVYVVPSIDLPTPGNWYLLALIKTDEGFQGAQLPTIKAAEKDKVVSVGEKAPFASTPVPADVGGDLSKIDTRIPADNMHEKDLADVLGKKPVIVLFSTPQLCQSRVCGPVVDIEAQVAEETGDDVEFIHSEIYNENDANKGLRPPVKAFELPSEPWLFAIDKNGVVRSRIEGAFGIDELRKAVKTAQGGGASQAS